MVFGPSASSGRRRAGNPLNIRAAPADRTSRRTTPRGHSCDCPTPARHGSHICGFHRWIVFPRVQGDHRKFPAQNVPPGLQKPMLPPMNFRIRVHSIGQRDAVHAQTSAPTTHRHLQQELDWQDRPSDRSSPVLVHIQDAPSQDNTWVPAFTTTSTGAARSRALPLSNASDSRSFSQSRSSESAPRASRK